MLLTRLCLHALSRNLCVMRQASKAASEYGGEKPFSEPESRIVRLVAESAHPRAFVNMHSGEWAVYVPWDSQQAKASDLPVQAHAPRLAYHVSTSHGCKCKGPKGTL